MKPLNNISVLCRDYIAQLNHKPTNYQISIQGSEAFLYAAPGEYIVIGSNTVDLTEDYLLSKVVKERIKRFLYNYRKLT